MSEFPKLELSQCCYLCNQSQPTRGYFLRCNTKFYKLSTQKRMFPGAGKINDTDGQDCTNFELKAFLETVKPKGTNDEVS